MLDTGVFDRVLSYHRRLGLGVATIGRLLEQKMWLERYMRVVHMYTSLESPR